MELLEAIYNRRAVRDYSAEAVPQSTLMDLLHAAVQAPSGMNQQPWAFAVFEGRERLAGWSDRAKPCFLATLPPGPDAEELRSRMADPSFNIFYNASVLVVICATPGRLHPAEDCCLAAQNFMLAAHAAGLGTCPIGLARPWLNLAEVKKEIGLPVDVEVVLPLIAGKPAGLTPRVSRREPPILVWS